MASCKPPIRRLAFPEFNTQLPKSTSELRLMNNLEFHLEDHVIGIWPRGLRIAPFENSQVYKRLTGLYSADSKQAGAHGDPPRQAFRTLRNSLRYRCGRNGRGLQSP